MPVYKYSVLKGDPQSGRVAGPADKPPHYHIEVLAGGVRYQVAVNIESANGSEVLYLINDAYTPPDTSALTTLPPGMTQLAGVDGNPAVDYVRSRAGGRPIVTRSAMTLLPLPGGAGSGNLQNAVIDFLNRAVADQNGTIYAFGSQYTDGTGIHDIHMNQGNPVNYARDNGVWQDGMLVFHMPGSNQWAAVFIAFQSESWSTDGNGEPA